MNVCVSVCLLAHLCLCNPMDCSPPGSSVHGLSQARILESGAVSLSRGSSPPRDLITPVSCIFCAVRPVLYHYTHVSTPHRSRSRTFPMSRKILSREDTHRSDPCGPDLFHWSWNSVLWNLTVQTPLICLFSLRKCFGDSSMLFRVL